MSSPQHPMTMENLPNDVLSNIFLRLLAKQLAQMRCVCKTLNSFLSQSTFIKHHLHHSIHANDEILLFFHEGFRLELDCHSLAARFSGSPDLELPNFIRIPVNPHSENSFGRVIGSVDGLICFSYKSYNDYVVYIWNPSISAVLTLPPSSLPSRNSTGIHFRFGFDPKTEDYKVFKLTELCQPSRMSPQVEVYSMRKGFWELITQEFPSHVIMIIDDYDFYINGHNSCLYLLGFTDLEWKTQTIVAFDLDAETFREILLPDSIQECQVYCNVLGVLGGKLCVMSHLKNGKYEVWVMDEYGVAESWVKHHVFSYLGCNTIPRGFTMNNKFIFKVGFNHFGLYDPVANKANTFRVLGGGFGISKLVKYVDSLVWVSPAARETSIS